MSAAPKYAGGSKARYLLLGATVYLVLLGLVMVYSASSVSGYIMFEDSMYHLKRHALFLGVGLLLMVLSQAVDYRKLALLAWPFLGVCLVALVLVLVTGSEIWGATRWLDLGFITVQPSEYAKLASLLVAALLLSQWRAGIIEAKQLAIRLLLVFSAVASLVMLQPDMGTTVIIAASIYLVLVLGRVSAALLAGMTAVGALGAFALMFLASYREERVLAFRDPWADPLGSGYQSIQAMLAFGSGGVDGLGVGMSKQKFSYLPAAHTDFIFAIIGEELGLIGSLSVVLAFGVITYAGFRIAFGSKDMFGRLVAGGLTGTIVIQAIINMAMVVGLMPVTGKPLPLVSYGGTAMTLTLICIGVILSVSSHGASGRATVRAPVRNKEHCSAHMDERRRDGGAHISSTGRRRSASARRT